MKIVVGGLLIFAFTALLIAFPFGFAYLAHIYIGHWTAVALGAIIGTVLDGAVCLAAMDM